MGDIIQNGKRGRDFFFHKALGEDRACSTICQFPHQGPCNYYCPDYVPYTTVFSEAVTTTFTTPDYVSSTTVFSEAATTTFTPSSFDSELLIALVASISLVLGLWCLVIRCRQRIVHFIKKSRLYNKIFPTRRGVPATDDLRDTHTDVETGANEHLISPCPAPIHSDGDQESEPSVNELLLQIKIHDTDERRNGHIPDNSSVDVKNVEEDRSEPRNVAREAQSLQDHLYAEKERSKDNDVIRGKKGVRMEFGGTKPSPCDHNDGPGTANTPVDDQQPVKNSTSFEDMSEAKAVPETKNPEEAQKITNQNTSPRSQNSSPVAHTSNDATATSNQTTELVQSVLNNERNRMHSNRSFVPSRNSVSLDHHDDRKQTENALNGQTLNPSGTH